MSLRVYSKAEVARHSTEGDLWIIVNSLVYDLSKWVDMHPGGVSVILDFAGKDCTAEFFSLHRSDVIKRHSNKVIGTTNEKPAYLLPIDGALSPVPYAEPAWLDPAFLSPYYDQSHRDLQKEMRMFFDTEVKAEAKVHEISMERPTTELMELMGSPRWNIHAMRMGPGEHLHGLTLPGGVLPEKFDYFHELVVIQELCRIGAAGYMAGLNAGMVIGLPAVLHHGSDKMKREVIPAILAGKKFISLAISEAFAGSDVSGVKTFAKKTEDGKFFRVTGQKKWITNGHYSDYFVTAVRTSPTALSMLLIPRSDAIETKIIKTAYSSSAGTALVIFEDALVPVENLLGQEGNGLKVTLENFNHERWVICARIARYSRMIYEETFKWAHLRLVFGKPLIEQPVIRQKIALMLSKIESGQTWLEHITYQMCKMDQAEQNAKLAGPIALLKQYLSKSGGEISDMATQIWGGRAITQGQMAVYIEQFNRNFKFDSILGGSEEPLQDLGVRQASRKMPKIAL